MDIRVLVIGTSRGGWKGGKKGDVWSVVPGDFGTAETANAWVQLTLTDAPDANVIQPYLTSIVTGFVVTEVSGAAETYQRYRVEVASELGSIPVPIFRKVRDGVISRFALSGSVEAQNLGSWFEFDYYMGAPLDEIHQEIRIAGEDTRRYTMGDNYVDNILSSVALGDPASDSQTWAWFVSNVQDKLG